jgi:uncharacterized protein YbjT (DUF2867 family)
MILVVGSTGRMGGMITRRLLAQGEDVRILVHPDADYDALEDAGCEPSVGDIKFMESFGPAFRDVDTVITTASATEPEDVIDTFEKVDVDGNRNLIDAAKAAGVKQFIFVSALGADPAHPHPYFKAKSHTESYLRISGMPYTILATAAYIDMWLERFIEYPLRRGEPVTIVGEGKGRHSFVSMTDVASFVTAMVGHPAAINKTIAIAGPEALTWSEVVDRTSKQLGQDLPVRHFKTGETLPGLSSDISRMAVNFEAHNFIVDMADTARTFGVSLTPLEDTISRVLG